MSTGQSIFLRLVKMLLNLHISEREGASQRRTSEKAGISLGAA